MGNCCTTLSESAPAAPAAPSAPALPSTSVNDIMLTDQKDNAMVYANATYENTPEYTLNGLRRTVKVIRILDGDTVDVALYHSESGRIYRHRVRLYGIDTPEKRPPLSDPNRQAEIAASLRAKQALEQRLQQNDFILSALFYQTDKYGREMCTFYDKQGEDINQWMIQQGHAYEYHGKTKKKFDSTEHR